MKRFPRTPPNIVLGEWKTTGSGNSAGLQGKTQKDQGLTPEETGSHSTSRMARINTPF